MKTFAMGFAASSLLLVANSSFAVPGGVHPCEKIRMACEAAGYVEGGAKTGKGLMKDCMKPAINGAPPAGVTIDPNDAAACKAKQDAKKAGPPPTTVQP